MLKIKKKIIISDVTLRDGNHAVNHSINEKVIQNYCAMINETGVNITEVGHGNGLGHFRCNGAGRMPASPLAAYAECSGSPKLGTEPPG